MINPIVRFLNISSFVFICSLGASDRLEQKDDRGDIVKIQKKLQNLINSFESKGKIGLQVTSLEDNTTIFEHGAKELFFPSSAVKLFVAGGALKILGPNFFFKTHVLTKAPIEKGVVLGDIYIQGSGDPSLTAKDFEDLIFQLKLKNIEEINGDLIFDASEFDDLKLGPGWMSDENNHLSHIPIDGLMINHSLVDIWIKPAEVAMMSPFIQIEPNIPGLTVENFAIMAKIDPFQSSLQVKKKQIKNKDVLSIEGVMPLNSSPLKFQVPVKNPVFYAATEFSLTLKKHHIKHHGKIRFEKKCDANVVLASHDSESLFNLARKMLKTNNDLYANCFLKKIGRVRFGKPGTWPNGAQAIREFLNPIIGDQLEGAILLDGSGESCYNRISPKMMTVFLQEVHHRFAFAPEFMACMPIAGVDGPFKKRFKQKSFYSKVRGFSDSSKGASFLCGYIITRDELCLAFCLMTSVLESPNDKIQEAIEDKLCDILFNLCKGA